MPHALLVDLRADIELIDNKTCLVHNIRRINSDEPSLLPVLKLVYLRDKWVHADSGKESHIGNAIGEAINAYILGRRSVQRG